MMNNIKLLREVNEKNNGDPLKNMPKSEMKLFLVDGIYFDNNVSLVEYCNKRNISLDSDFIYELEYIRNVAGKNDVISINANGCKYLVCATDEDGYSTYNFARSTIKGEFTWVYNFGNISEYYKAFRDKGIVFENDVYAKISKKYKRIAEMAR